MLIPHPVNTPAEAALCKAVACYKHRDGAIRAFLFKELVGLNASLNVPKMTQEQLLEAVKVIMSERDYMDLKPEDFVVCFNQARKGRYGKSFNRIDIQVVCEWLNAYCDEREDSIIAHNRNNKHKYMAFPDHDKPLSPIFCDELKAKFTKLPEVAKRKTRERNVADDWHDEFDVLAKAQEVKPIMGQPIIVEYKGKYLDRQEYINLRFEEENPA